MTFYNDDTFLNTIKELSIRDTDISDHLEAIYINSLKLKILIKWLVILVILKNYYIR